MSSILGPSRRILRINITLTRSALTASRIVLRNTRIKSRSWIVTTCIKFRTCGTIEKLGFDEKIFLAANEEDVEAEHNKGCLLGDDLYRMIAEQAVGKPNGRSSVFCCIERNELGTMILASEFGPVLHDFTHSDNTDDDDDDDAPLPNKEAAS